MPKEAVSGLQKDLMNEGRTMASITLVNIGLMPITEEIGREIHGRELMSELLSIAAVLESQGFDVEFRDYATCEKSEPLADPKGLADFLEGSGEKILFHIYHFFLPFVILAAREIKIRWPQKKITLAGKGPTPVAHLIVEAFPWIDGVFCGEAEQGALAWAMGTPAMLIPGFCFRDKGRLTVTSPFRSESLDALPMPAYHLASPRDYSQVHVLASRGCTRGCTYCYNVTYWGQRRTVRPVENIVKEMTFLHKEYGIDEIILEDDNFVLDNREWGIEFCQALIREKSDFRWVALCRVDQIDEELLELMGRSGCSHIILGFETGSDSIMQGTRKNTAVSQAIKAVKIAGKAIENVLVPFLWGFPFETMDDLKKTVQVMTYVHESLSASVRLNMVVPLPGTPLTETYRDHIFYSDTVLPFNKSKYYLKPCMGELIHLHRRIFSAFYTFRTPDLEKKTSLLRRLFPYRSYEGRLSIDGMSGHREPDCMGKVEKH
jgi:anaerobic magnesium-protoporphyrin IX monomethyl ester cyclase